MQVVISPDGTLRCVYGEAIDLQAFGQPEIRRASHVEPDGHGQWTANLMPVEGPVLGPFPQRSEALAAESQWLEANWLSRSS